MHIRVSDATTEDVVNRYCSKLLCASASGVLIATAPVAADERVDSGAVVDALQTVTVEPAYAAPVEEGAYVHASPPAELDLTIDVLRALTPEQINEALGVGNTGLSGVVSPTDRQLELIEVRATREQFQPLQTPIPLGLASIAWAIRNPSEAWRIVFPVLGA